MNTGLVTVEWLHNTEKIHFQSINHKIIQIVISYYRHLANLLHVYRHLSFRVSNRLKNVLI